MEFKKMSIGNQIYGTGNEMEWDEWTISNVNFKDDWVFNKLWDSSNEDFRMIHDFMLNLALCHTVISEHDDSNKIP